MGVKGMPLRGTAGRKKLGSGNPRENGGIHSEHPSRHSVAPSPNPTGNFYICMNNFTVGFGEDWGGVYVLSSTPGTA